MDLLFILCITIFNIIPTLSLPPNCDNIIISCPGSDPNCCQGPCCSFLHQYQTLSQPSTQEPQPTTTESLPPWFIPQNTPKPNLNEECTSEVYSPYQCSSGLKCKFNGQYNPNMYLTGQCKVRPEETGCQISSDCYRLNDVCINGRCSVRIQFPFSTQPISPINPTIKPKPSVFNQENNGVSSNNAPIINRGRSVDDNLEDKEYEVKGGNRNIPLKMSEQLQLVIGILCALCALCAIIKCCSIVCRLKGEQKYIKASSNADERTDCAVEADVEWSDETEQNNEENNIEQEFGHKPGDEKSIMNMKSDKEEYKLVIQIPCKHKLKKIKKQFRTYSDDDLL